MQNKSYTPKHVTIEMVSETHFFQPRNTFAAELVRCVINSSAITRKLRADYFTEINSIRTNAKKQLTY